MLEAGAIDGARGILINVTGSSSLRLAEVNEASTIIQSAAHEDANIIFGAVLDEKMKDDVKITVIATGFKDMPLGRQHSNAEAAEALHTVRSTASVQGTYEVSVMRTPDPVVAKAAPMPPELAPRAVQPEPFQPAPRPQPQPIQYIPESLDDFDSEIVRHAQPVDEVTPSSGTYARDTASGYLPGSRDRAFAPSTEPSPAIESTNGGLKDNYEPDDLEIPAFLRKRGDA